MKTVAVIAEYNPFHNGHAYQLQYIREKLHADNIVIAISGNFTQRGLPAITDKWTRAKMALSCGADLVLELPAIYATGSAEYFASGAVKLLDSLGVVDELVFGAENASTEMLMDIARSLVSPNQLQENRLKELVSKGISYPTARMQALQETDRFNGLDDVLSLPNNILGIEYCKALLKQHSKIKPYALKRLGAGYHEVKLPTGDGLENQSNISTDYNNTANFMASATAIREVMNTGENNISDKLKQYLPTNVLSILSENDFNTVCPDDYSQALYYKLLSEQNVGFTRYFEITEDFSNKICKNLADFKSLTQFAALLKSKDLTQTRIYRNLLHILLNIDTETFDELLHEPLIPYARILGLKKNCTVLSAIKNNSSVPLISKLADIHTLNLSDSSLRIMEKDLLATDIYRLGYLAKGNVKIPDRDVVAGVVAVN
ncbi:MAG: nucleotidyltransferase family protein [Lachnospiraceae bacterium]|nr:nucleotidyltransferase family protein [Lachnospiraceae bacterium]